MDQQQRRVTPTSGVKADADVSHAAADISDSEMSVDDSKQLLILFVAFTEYVHHLTHNFPDIFGFLDCPIAFESIEFARNFYFQACY